MKKNKGYNVDVFIDSKIRIEKAIGIFTTDASGKPLVVKKSGNGAVIPFLKRYINKKAIVFIQDD